MLSVKLVAHFFYEHGRPPPSEIASSAAGGEEGFLCHEPHQFFFGAQTSLFSALSCSVLSIRWIANSSRMLTVM